MILRTVFLFVLAGCASIPETHRYALVVPNRAAAVAPSQPSDELPTITIEELEVDAAYDDPRIAYRPTKYRFEYYHYHRWTAPPSLLLSDYLREAFARSGRFARVTRAIVPQTTIVLRGRLTAFEELDVSDDRWLGRVALELFAEDPKSGKILWSRRFDEREPLVEQSPAGLARALSSAVQRIANATMPATSRIAALAPPAGNEDDALKTPVSGTR